MPCKNSTRTEGESVNYYCKASQNMTYQKFSTLEHPPFIRDLTGSRNIYVSTSKKILRFFAFWWKNGIEMSNQGVEGARSLPNPPRRRTRYERSQQNGHHRARRGTHRYSLRNLGRVQEAGKKPSTSCGIRKRRKCHRWERCRNSLCFSMNTAKQTTELQNSLMRSVLCFPATNRPPTSNPRKRNLSRSKRYVPFVGKPRALPHRSSKMGETMRNRLIDNAYYLCLN